MPEILTRQIQVTRLAGFCLFGFVNALFILFRKTLDGSNLDTIHGAMGWDQWPLDFMESSDWPTLWRMVPLHYEQYLARGDTSWSASLEKWGDDDWLLPRPRVHEVELDIVRWLYGLGVKPRQEYLVGYYTGKTAQKAAQRLASWSERQDRTIAIAVLGHHLGSS